MNLKNWRELFFILCMISTIQWFILTSVAMFFYTGGTRVDPGAPGYSFWANFFSDLGRTKSHSGKDNTISYILFTITFSVGGICTILFAIAFPYFFTEIKIERQLSIIGSFFIVIMGIVTIGIAFAPWDIYVEEHDLLAFIEGLTSSIGRMLYIYVIFHNKKYPNRYAFTYIIALAISGCILIFLNLFVVPLENVSTTEELMFWTTAQKIIVYTGYISGLIIIYGAWKQLKS